MGKKGKKNKQRKNYAQLNNSDCSSPQGKGGKRRSKRPNRKCTSQNSIVDVDDHEFRESVEEGGSRNIIEICADGNCLFRSISDQLYEDYGNMHDEVRKDVCDYIEANEDEFAVFLVLDETEEDEDAANFVDYCQGMREDGAWGGNVELVAAARLYRRNITVFSVTAAFTIQHDREKSTGPDMLLSYHDNDHYNSVRDNLRSPLSIPKQSQTDDSEQKNETNCSADDLSSNEKANTGKKSRPRSVKPSDPCSCGSGKRYKKCCLATEKRQERLKKWKEKNGIDDDGEKESKDDFEKKVANGKLKVLSI